MIKLTARLRAIDTKVKIHRANCGTIPISFNWTEKRLIIKEYEGFRLFIDKNHGSIVRNLVHWLEPLPPEDFIKALPLAIKEIREGKGSKCIPCSLCRAYEIVQIKGDEDECWLTIPEAS